MRKLVFAPYTAPADGEKVPPVVRVWALLFQSVNNPSWKAGDDMLKVRAAARMIEKMEAAQETVVEDKVEKTHLKYDGATVLLEDAEFSRLEDAWKNHRTQLPGGMSVEVVRVTDFLDKAPTVEAKEVEAQS